MDIQFLHSSKGMSDYWSSTPLTTPTTFDVTSVSGFLVKGFDMTSGNVTDTTLLPQVSLGSNNVASGLVSAKATQLVLTIVNAGILPVLVLFGVTGNVINMAVFARQGLSDRVNICLFSLALSDSGFNLFHFASRLNALFGLFDSALAEYWQSRGLIFIGVYMGFLNTSNTLILIVSLERCVCVISPLRAKRLFSA
ncbi:hypothetical protein BaRGS_00032113, partial [Batillaria attramentaria]